ncbi:hypothetical protein FJZ31_18520 [Candidatus Poribacteria bacterium]|nr:hypothetical protein [Candidatus Poribacteria bacterium]
MTRNIKHNCAWILASLIFSGLLGLASISVLMIAIPSTSAWAGTLKDNFDDGNMDGWDLSGAPRDTWEVKDGELVVTPRSWPVWFLLGKTTWKDYTVRVRAKIVKYQSTGYIESAEILARATSPLYWYAFGFGSVGLGTKDNFCCPVQGDLLVSVLYNIFEWELDKWYDLKLVAEGDQFKFYMNDELVIDYTYSTYPAGKVGIGATFSGTTAHFDDFSVTGDDVPDGFVAPVEAKGKLAISWGKIKTIQ